MRYLTNLITAGALMLSLFAPMASKAAVSVSSGDRIKFNCPTSGVIAPDHGCRSVYYYGANGKRYVFPTDKTYFTWYANFTGVKTITLSELGTIMIGGNVTYKPGVKMIKINTDPKTYVVAKGGVLRWVQTEAIARAHYGNDWNTKIDDIPDPFFSNYKVGADVAVISDYNPQAERDGVTTINEDKNLSSVDLGNPSAANVSFTVSGFSQSSVTVRVGGTVTWTNNSSSQVRISSNPHPTHSDLPGLDSQNLAPGDTYVFTFNQAGTWGYHNHLDSSQTGTVIVQ